MQPTYIIFEHWYRVIFYLNTNIYYNLIVTYCPMTSPQTNLTHHDREKVVLYCLAWIELAKCVIATMDNLDNRIHTYQYLVSANLEKIYYWRKPNLPVFGVSKSRKNLLLKKTLFLKNFFNNYIFMYLRFITQ